jgi:hypothetical protein
MVTSVAQAIDRIKSHWARQFTDESIDDACRAAGHQWRQRTLPPALTVRLFLLQILYGNTACSHLPRISGEEFTPQAYSAARARLPRAALETLLANTVSQLGQAALDTARWLGHRVFLVDGSTFSTPDVPELQTEFGQPGGQAAGCGFPVAHWLALMHHGSGLILKMLVAPLRTHDQSQVAELHPELAAGDVLLGDRGLCSFVHLALLFGRSLHGVFRMHQQQIVDFTPGRPHRRAVRGRASKKKGMPTSRWIRSLGQLDQLVEWFKPVKCPNWLSPEQFAALPGSLIVRELHYRIERPGFRVEKVTLVTTLVDAERYSKEVLAQLYLERWRIETNFAHLKTTLGMDALHCQSVEGVLKEATMFALVYNLVRLLMCEAAKRQGVPVERISFIDALRALAHADLDAPFPTLIINPERPNRREPRLLKRRPKQFGYLKEPRANYRAKYIAATS